MEIEKVVNASEFPADVRRYIGLLINFSYGTDVAGPIKSSQPVRMPCGYVVAPPESGWPLEAVTIQCPCGDARHILFQRT